MTRKWAEDVDQDQETVEPGSYTVEIVDARSADTKSGGSMVFMDMKIIGGPDDGRVVPVSVNLPREGEKGIFFARRATRGFPAQMNTMSQLPDEDQADWLAGAIIGLRMEADLSRQTDPGPYQGNQQLDATRQIVQVAPAARPAQQTQTETVAAPAAEPAVDPNPPF
jgi:hypothetical protein